MTSHPLPRAAPAAPDAAGWSLRGRLLALTAASTLAALLAGGVATFIAARAESEQLFDRRLEDLGRLFLAIADHEIDEMRAEGRGIVDLERVDGLAERFDYQIWSPSGELLLVSEGAPRLPLAPFDQIGAKSRVVDGVALRVVVTWSPDRSKLIEVAEPESARTTFIGTFDNYLLAMVAAAFAVLFAASGWMIRRATGALADSARQLTAQSPHDLHPLQVDHPPRELAPLVRGINVLFERFAGTLAAERRFTAAAAHELRTPLAAVRAHAQVAQMAHTPDQMRSELAPLTASIDRAAHLVDQLLTLARVDGMAALHPHRAAVQLDQVARDVLDEMGPRLKACGARLVADLRPVRVVGLEFALGALLRNLIDNAAKYGPPGGVLRLVVGATEAPRRAFVTVEDAGPGIPDGERERIFEPFYRVPGSGADGCGIGLSIVRSALQMHQAEIRLGASELGGLLVRVEFDVPTT